MLSDYLSPIPTKLFSKKNFSVTQWGKKLKVYKRNIPDLSAIKVAIIGIDSQQVANEQLPTHLIRKQLYQLHSWENSLAVADLGNIKNGATHRDTYFAIREVMAFLLENKVIPLLIGDSLDLAYGQFLGHSQQNKKTKVAMFTKEIDLFAKKEQATFLYKMLTQETNLADFAQLGYQRYLVNPAVVESLSKLSFNCYSLGELKANLAEVEPIIRNMTMVAFQLSTICYADAVGTNQPSPTGFLGQEACQIAQYAGLSDYISSFGCYGYVPTQDSREQTAQLIAQMIWYFVDGVHHRQNDFPNRPENRNDYLTYLVQLYDYEITFVKSKKSNRWWIESPSNKKSKKTLLPCSYADYEAACKGEIPDRWIQVNNK